MPRIISNFFIIASETIIHIKICFYSYKKFIIFFNKLHLQKHVIYSKIAFMKKIAISFFTLIFATSAALANANPFMGEHNHQIALNAGAGVNSGFIVPPPTQFVPFMFLHFQYSQPTTFFKVPARQSINIGQTLGLGTGYGWDWTEFTIPMIFLSEDIAIAHGKNWYFSTGVGVGLQAQQNERLGAKLLFQFKLAGGYRINDKWGIELFVQHFSNANTAPENNSYAFYGTGFTYSF